ncbi:Potassium voltage-gated channel subfamily D member 3 [Liparis tanakae]|uniref:Potassium voltage-gated channel subfamily D member 3 n=1 Tax=Liparis tanakae TaxID=230148 RepID=A0A4Z2HKK4_9TELE|nr:Potassium voltage-gated channel subfamily D member 3 [Liparis tanakae]
MYQQNFLDTALQSFPSRSPSLSSPDSSGGSCCGRRGKRNTPLPSGHPIPTHQGPLQELSAIHIQCCDRPSRTAGRSNLNRKTDDSGRLNSKGSRITTAIISLPSPPALTPDGDSLRRAPQRRPPLTLGHPAAPSIQTTTSSAGTNVVKVSSL